MAANDEPTPAELERNQLRFETELEFIQCLANPFYLQSLAQNNFFSDPQFINYLKYLSYFHNPKYARFIQYPQALHHLKLLNDPSKALIEALERDQNLPQDLAGASLAHWSSWREQPQPPKSGSGQAQSNGVNGNGILAIM